jgi:DNA invertase Pin-like site-specific DNA recombinase
MTIYAYARISTDKQNIEMQLDALEKHGYDDLFQEQESSKKERPQLQSLKSKLKPGDTFVTWKYDRVARSVIELVTLITDLKNRNINFISLTEKIDTGTPQGKLFATIMAGLGEFERDLISERTKEGLKAAKARGRLGGRPKGMEKKVVNLCKLIQHEANANEEISISSLLTEYNVSRGTYYKFLKRQKENKVELQAELKIGVK